MMDDSSTKFFNIKTLPPTQKGSPPVVAVPNVKTIVISFLKQKLQNLNLTHPIEVYSDQPYYINMFQRAQESGRVDLPVKRWVDVLLLSSSVKMRGVGEIVKTREIEEAIGKEIAHYGWIESTELQVTYASIQPDDRDRVGHLIKLYIFEAHRSGYLLRNGIFSMMFRTEYDSFDQRVELNQPIYYRVMHFIFESFFFAVTSLEEELGVTIEDIDLDLSFDGGETDGILLNSPADEDISTEASVGGGITELPATSGIGTDEIINLGDGKDEETC